MAKKPNAPKKSKSAAIRDFREANADAGPKAIAEALNADGYNVNAQFVSTVLSNQKRRGGAPLGKRGRKPMGGLANMNDLLAAKEMVAKVGSVLQARAAIEAYAKLL
jgi:hypothetical protein